MINIIKSYEVYPEKHKLNEFSKLIDFIVPCNLSSEILWNSFQWLSLPCSLFGLHFYVVFQTLK